MRVRLCAWAVFVRYACVRVCAFACVLRACLFSTHALPLVLYLLSVRVPPYVRDINVFETDSEFPSLVRAPMLGQQTGSANFDLLRPLTQGQCVCACIACMCFVNECCVVKFSHICLFVPSCLCARSQAQQTSANFDLL